MRKCGAGCKGRRVLSLVLDEGVRACWDMERYIFYTRFFFTVSYYLSLRTERCTVLVHCCETSRLRGAAWTSKASPITLTPSNMILLRIEMLLTIVITDARVGCLASARLYEYHI